MIKHCNTCGTYWVVNDINECCPECGEQKDFIKYKNEQEIVDKLNAIYKQNHKKEPRFYVFNAETKETLFVGSQSACEKYIKKHETVWTELFLMECK